MQTRSQQLAELALPRFRLDQLHQALFDPRIQSVQELTTWSKELRTNLESSLPWTTLYQAKLFSSKDALTHKAILETSDGQQFESVLMSNTRGQWSLCISSQIGCAMACTFCATGTMGLTRHLSVDEIIDQYRYWQRFLFEQGSDKRISNIIFMGMGEPLANYDNVKQAIRLLLDYTDLGPTKIVVSSVGVLSILNKLNDDPEWPDVRVAISLHAAIEVTRKEIVPSTVPNFFERLKEWAHDYHQKRGNRSHYITFEYIMLDGVNDTEKHAHALGEYAKECMVKKVNIIPYNTVKSMEYAASQEARMARFADIVRAHGVDITRRKNRGGDIDAACGQLVVLGKKSKNFA